VLDSQTVKSAGHGGPVGYDACSWQKRYRMRPGREAVFRAGVGRSSNGGPSGEGAERIFASRRESTRSTPPLVVVPGHLCPSPNGSDCGGNIRSRI
jgi:hypothetical protein